MEQLGTFCLGVVAAGMTVAMVTGLFHKKGAAAQLVKMIGGLFLAFTVIRPLVNLDVSGSMAYLETFSDRGNTAAAMGENMAQDSYLSYIKAETQAYILDKAQPYGAAIQVEVELDEKGVPCGAILTGTWSPYARSCLSQMMAEDLGLEKEAQQWIG